MGNVNYNNLPVSLTALPRWVGFKVWWVELEGKFKKMPIDIRATVASLAADPTAWKDVPASSNNPETWCNFETALKWHKDKKQNGKYKYYLGFAFGGDDIMGIDLDKCVGEKGELSDFAKSVIQRVPSYTEYSPSGKGVHIIAKCSQELPCGMNRGIEMYSSGRFFTMTGNVLEGSVAEIVDCTEAIASLYNEHSKPFEGVVGGSKGFDAMGEGCIGNGSSGGVGATGDNGLATNNSTTSSKTTSTTVTLSDNDLIEKARNSKDGADFDALWRGDFSSHKSQSEADLALCKKLAFWTGKDHSRIDSLFRQSGLYRKKWDEKRGAELYGQATIRKAMLLCTETYTPPKPKKEKSKKQNSAAPLSDDAVIVEKDSAYYIIQSNGKSKRLTNFIIQLERKLVTEEESIFAVELISADKKAIMQFRSTDMVSVQALKKRLSERDIGWSLMASEREFELIKEHLNSKPCREVVGFKGIGLLHHPAQDNSNAWVYVGEKCAMDSLGNRVEDVESLPCENQLRCEIETAEEISKHELETVGKALTEYNDPMKTLSILCWMAAAMAKPKLVGKGIKFPHLVIVGEQSSGKSFTTEFVLQAFFSLKSLTSVNKVTAYSFLTSSGASNCIPLLLQEYKASTMKESLADNIHNGLRDLYDGHDGERGRADMTVKKYKLTVPLVLIGEEAPSEPAIKERSIQLLFSLADIKNRKTVAEYLENPFTQDIIRQLGKATLLTVLRESGSSLKNAYDNALRAVNKKLPERIQKNIAAVSVGAYILDKTAKHYSSDFERAFGVPISDIVGIITDAVKRYTLGGGTYNKSVVDKVFDTLDAMTDVLKVDVHYKYINAPSHPETPPMRPLISFDIKRIYEKYLMHMRSIGHKGELLDSSMFQEQLECKDYFVKRNHQTKLKETEQCGRAEHNTKCWVLDARRLAQCCDISNILERCKIDLDKLPQGVQVTFDDEVSRLADTG